MPDTKRLRARNARKVIMNGLDGSFHRLEVRCVQCHAGIDLRHWHARSQQSHFEFVSQSSFLVNVLLGSRWHLATVTLSVWNAMALQKKTKKNIPKKKQKPRNRKTTQKVKNKKWLGTEDAECKKQTVNISIMGWLHLCCIDSCAEFVCTVMNNYGHKILPAEPHCTH